ncbi:restriction endonuclease subunit S [Halocynthiibacter sp.]|uniref:restriction endonuclease subunit S n=1 Tax=Halocynthiibacter sp. TaxID=1979210 RepID=UPI003C587961
MLDEVPNGWVNGLLNSCVAKVFGGGTPSRKNADFWNGEIFWASVKDFTKFHPTQTQETITDAGLTHSSAKVVKAGTLIVATRMAVGSARVFEVDVAINQDLKAIEVSKNCDRDFLNFWLECNRPLVEAQATGTTVKGISQSALLGLPLLVPPLDEQQRIAEILTSVDETIRVTEAVIAQTERVKLGVMENLLTGGLGSDAIANGEVPDGWELCLLGNLSSKKGMQTGPFGSQLKASEYVEHGPISVVMPKEIIGGTIQFDRCSKIDEIKAEQLTKHFLKTGDLLFARRGDLSKISMFDGQEEQAICGTGCLRCRPNLEQVDPQFLAKILTMPSSIEWLETNAVGQTMLNLNTNIISDLPLIIPPKVEQQRVVNALDSIDEDISVKRALLSQTKRLKQGLMSDLLTGRKRVT